MIVDVKLMELLFWYVDFIDSEMQHPTLSRDDLTKLSFDVCCRLLPTIDQHHETSEPPEGLNYAALIEMIRKLPFDGTF